MSDITFHQFLVVQSYGGGLYYRLGTFARGLNGASGAPLAKEDALAFWLGKHYTGHQDEGLDPEKLAFSALENFRRVLPYFRGQTSELVPLGSLSTADLFSAENLEVDWLVWPFLAKGLSTIFDALPKMGKTRFFLEGIIASRQTRIFLNHAAKPIKVIYISEQSAPSLAMQAREVGFTGAEPIEEVRWITREHWSRLLFTDLLAAIEREHLEHDEYDALIFDTWHTEARLENENDASEVNRLGNLTLDLAARHRVALAMSRHDRKSGGDIGLSGRSSIQLSGLVDVIIHLKRLGGQTPQTQRKLELLGRVPNLPNEQVIELIDGQYKSYGDAEGGGSTTRAAEVIMANAPHSREQAEQPMEILEGTGLAYDRPVRDALEQLTGSGKLESRKAKGKKVYWIEDRPMGVEDGAF